ncbi:MAG: hypothetical protein M3M93_04420, partial [Actinomycetota bacterium]|nr:hypothetical protein [Actinomycetota bacterium]
MFSSLSGSRRPSPRYPSLTSIVVILPMTRSKIEGHGIAAQGWDIPMDWVVTERGIYRRDPDGLA